MTQPHETQPLGQMSLMKTLSLQQPYQKAVNSVKQVTQIRKITQQTLSPVIKKVQQHISYLLQQSKALRIQTSTLQQVQATNLQYKQQIQLLNNKLKAIQNQIIETGQQNQLKQRENESRFVEHQVGIEELAREGKDKADKIKKLTTLNQNQTKLFAMAKDGMVSATDFLKQEMTTFYQKTIHLNNQNTQKFTNLDKTLSEHNSQILQLQNHLSQVATITSLYTSQRQHINQHLSQVLQITQQSILREEYEKDKKYHMIENELVKSHVERTVNEALTPEIRSFLPSLIHNIQLLKRLQKQIALCTEDITTSKQTQKELQQKILRLQHSTKKSIEQKNIETKQLSLLLDSKTSSLHQKITQLHSQIQPQLKSIQSNLNQQKSHCDQMFQTFIQKNRTKIYLAVLECKPPEVREEENRIKQKLNTFQQQMESISQKANQRSDNVLSIGQSLDAKLELFQNRITKAKSDLKVQNDNIKKVIQGFNVKLQQGQAKNHQQSQTISKLLEVSMLNTSLHIDEEYLQVNPSKYGEESQSYISFHDGVIYEASGETKRNQTLYRKKKLNKQILKRSLLNQQAKLVDFITEKLKSWKWQDQKQRPSQFFVQHVYPAYETMLKDKKQVIQAKRHYYEQKIANYKMPSNMLSQRRSKGSITAGNSTSKIQPMHSKHLSKGSFDQKEKSREKDKKKFNNTSIDMPRGASLAQRIQAISQHTELHTTIDFHKPNRIKLKKIDQTQKESTKDNDNAISTPVKTRYGFSKQTI